MIDLGEETVGLPVLEFISQYEQKILVAWGEDLQNGHVRRLIDGRDFSFEYIAKKGEISIFLWYNIYRIKVTFQLIWER